MSTPYIALVIFMSAPYSTDYIHECTHIALIIFMSTPIYITLIIFMSTPIWH